MTEKTWVDKAVAVGIVALAAKRLLAMYKQHKVDRMAGLDRRRDDAAVTQASMDSFPASDPPSWSPTVAAP